MIDTAKQANQEENQIKLEGTANEILKAFESLKQIGIRNIKYEFFFTTIEEIEIFTRILNREQDEQRVANQLKTTYFHHIRGKVQRLQIVRDEDYVSMKKIAFTSSYHAHLFIKYNNQRVQQLQNQYKYKITEGKSGYLHIYLNEENISSLFLNQLIDMKKKLKFLQIKDPELCQKFIHSRKLSNQLRKQNIFHEIWYKGKQSTIIFYTQNNAFVQLKKIIDIVSKHHMTILKMVDFKFSFLVNYLLFGLMKKLIEPELKSMKSIESDFVEVNDDKIAIVLHDIHKCFSLDPVLQTLEIIKKIFFINIKARNARKYYNFMKKQYIAEPFVNFCYSKKNVCICIHTEKIQSWVKVRKMLNGLAQCLDIESQIVLNYFHLQFPELEIYRKQLIHKIAVILAESNFSIDNFQKFIQDKDYKCIVKLKDFSKRSTLCSYASQILLEIIKDIHKNKTSKQIMLQSSKQPIFLIPEIQNQNQSQSQQSQESNEQSEQQEDKDNSVQVKSFDQDINAQVLFNLNLEQQKIYSYEFYERILQKENQIRQMRFFSQGTSEWKQEKRLKPFENQLLKSLKIISKVYLITLQRPFKDKIPNFKQIDNSIFFYPYEDYPKYFTEQVLREQLKLKCILRVSLSRKYIIIVRIEQGLHLLRQFPIFSIQIHNTI